MHGLGVDIVDVARIERLVKNKNFLKKIFTKDEIKYCSLKKHFAQHYAVRFAAKESVWKALGQKITHKEIGIRNAPDGKPRVFIKGRQAKNIFISLSHTTKYAVAFCAVDEKCR